ncbi:RNA recognition protein, RNP-1 [Cordyceps militaris CM01]|uniref:RNA recognition protein, RNP-1 n=1 Tax=Cordyceps militaris (strain CM01) TaxID=983644 RepID=G3JFT7_CORMM|nr:RNA recognition protein, RNP-1 [Cordyceps militaris CM01]EGX93171.1 RNA recognition protein, RNP-1 [Cordyceps militaris CM01]
MSDAARWKATVYVGGLAPQVTNANVVDAFIPFGEIVEVKLPKPDASNTGQTHKGFAYVEFEDSSDAKEAIDNMDQAEFFGRTLKVSLAKAPKSAQEGLGSKTAIWDQEGWLAENAAGEADLQAPSGPDPMQGLEDLDVAGPKQQ